MGVTSSLAGVNVGTGCEFLFLGLPGLILVVVTGNGLAKFSGVSGSGDRKISGVAGSGDREISGVSGGGDRRTFGVSGLGDTYVAGAIYIVAVGLSSLNTLVNNS